MKALDSDSVSNILSSTELNNPHDVLRYLYSSTNARWFSKENWDTNDLKGLDFENTIAIMSIPKTKIKDSIILKWFTWNISKLGKLIDSNHVLALKKYIELDEITEILAKNPEKWHIIIKNLFDWNYAIYEIRPNWYNFETTTNKQIKKPAQNTTPTQIRNILLQIW